MAEGRTPTVYTIPPHRAFADALVAGLLARAGGDPLALARTTLLLPNNRARRSISDAFVRRAGEGGLLLPRMVVIGDPELGDALGTAFDPADAADPVPPAIEPLERQLILARLVQDSRRLGGDAIDAAEAMHLAADLARTLDQLIVEEIDPHRLRDVVIPEQSIHWEVSLAALDAILHRWPDELSARKRIDLTERRNRLLDRAAAHWRAHPPEGAVVAAGITTSAPAIARLLRVVADLDQGMVVIPAIDCDMPAEEWDALGPNDSEIEGGLPRGIESHPQYHLKLLLDRMGIARGEVRRWRWGGRIDAPAARSRAVAHAMAPAEFTAKWQRLRPADRRVSGVRAAIFATPGEEAQAIALSLREALETPGRTAALVTPDRALARRVLAHLRRWGIEADDSAGEPFSLSPPGTLLLAAAEAMAEDFAPVPLLALLKHPLVRAGEGRLAWLDGVRRLDLALRGPRPPSGLDGISAFLAEGTDRERARRGAAQDMWAEVRSLLAPLEAQGLGGLVAALREGVSALAGDAAWTGPAGRCAAELIAGLERHAPEGPALERVEAFPALLRDLFDGVAIRAPQRAHPRIAILGVLEARLEHADLVIAGGLNEGVWPAAPAPDPWLAPAIRRALGLPGLERRIGLAAHDFAGALGAPQVLITRAARDARAPTIASRFLLRLEAMTGGVTRATRLNRLVGLVDRHEGSQILIPRPAPRPPVADRPRRIAVTRLDRLQADPFAFYAGAMLRLDALDRVDADPTPAWRGTMIHSVFEAWMTEDGCDPTRLRPRAEALLGRIAAHPVLKALWEPRLMAAIDWAGERMLALKVEGRVPVAAEIFGETLIDGIELYGKVDRIDRLADGSLAIVDYKTGMPPSKAQVEAGFALQLGLLGLIAERGGYEGVAGIPLCFEYWSLAKDKGAFGHVASPTTGKNALDPASFTARAEAQLREAIARWLLGDDPFVARLHPDQAAYGDYDQLMRLDEWQGRADGA